MSIKIIYPTPFYVNDLLGGGELTMHEFLKSFVKDGWESTAFVVSRGENKIYTLDGVRIVENNYQTYIQAFERLVEEYRPDIGLISSIDVAQSFAFFSVLKKHNIRVITYEQFYRNIYSVFQNMLNIPIDAKRIPPEGREILTKADAVMVNSDYTGLVLKRYIGRDGLIVYPPIDYSRVISTEHTREFVTLINPSLHKGKDTFLSLAKDFPGTKFMVVEMPHDKASGPEFSLPNITVLPFQTDVREIYKRTKILLFPTLTDESFGRSMLEAMANGIPVVARKVGGIPYVLGKAGVLIDRAEPNVTWFRELKRLLEDDSFYTQMSKAAFDRYKAFDYDREINKVKTIVKDLVSNKAIAVTPIIEDDDLLITKLDKMDVHDDFVNDDGTTVRRNSGEIYFGEPNAYDIITLTVNFPSVREILISVVKEIGKRYRAAFVDFSPDRQLNDYIREVAREITKISPKLLILGAWVPYYAPLIEHIKKNSRTKIALSWHSNFSQMELSLDHEMDMFLGVSSLLKAGKIDYLFMSDEEDSALLKHTINPNIFWLPDFLDMDFTKQASKLPMSSDAFKVSLFAFPTSRKNLLAQVAAVRAVNKAILYTNDLVRPRQRQNINYAQFFNSINVNHVNCGWMTKEKYYSTMVSMDVGLQVSFAETFSIVTAEHMALGVPCLVSSMVPVLKNNPALTENLLIRNANSAKEMAHKLSILRDNPDLRNNLGNICKEHIMGLNDRHKTAAVSMIGTLLASI